MLLGGHQGALFLQLLPHPQPLWLVLARLLQGLPYDHFCTLSSDFGNECLDCQVNGMITRLPYLGNPTIIEDFGYIPYTASPSSVQCMICLIWIEATAVLTSDPEHFGVTCNGVGDSNAT